MTPDSMHKHVEAEHIRGGPRRTTSYVYRMLIPCLCKEFELVVDSLQKEIMYIRENPNSKNCSNLQNSTVLCTM